MRGEGPGSEAGHGGASEEQELHAAFEPESSSRQVEPEDAPLAAAPPGEGARERSDAELEREIAALLFASNEPLSLARLSALCAGTAPRRVTDALEAVRQRLERSGLPLELRAIAGGWQLFTTPEMAACVAALARVRRDEKLSPAALETLSVLAYRQPVTKAEIEVIRGVLVGPILRTLVERGLARVVGRSPDPGHALLYGTTRRFLDLFALASLSDLPRDGELLKD